jgi:hypothetical protein
MRTGPAIPWWQTVDRVARSRSQLVAARSAAQAHGVSRWTSDAGTLCTVEGREGALVSGGSLYAAGTEHP